VPDSEAPPANTQGKKSQFVRWRVLCLGLVILTLGYLFATLHEAQPAQFEWIGNIMQPSPLRRLKYTLVRLAGPLLKWYKPNRRNLVINVDLIGVPAQWNATAGIGSAVSTNQDGTRAWILPETEFRQAVKIIKDANGADLINSSRVTTSDGSISQVQITDLVPVAATNGSVVSYPVGTTVDLAPKIVAHSIRLVVGLTSTSASPATNGVKVVRIDAQVCSRALLPNGGGLIMSAGTNSSAVGTNLWLLLSTSAADARGARIKL
jgi:hypothetical protein